MSAADVGLDRPHETSPEGLPLPTRPYVPVQPGQPLWVFGYGSLMWNPGFVFEERVPARLNGYHRRFCVYSHRYRGTPEAPGLVLGLDRGGSCRGLALRVAPGQVPQTLAYLWQREMVTGVYRPRLVTIRLLERVDGEQRVAACTFVADRRHKQYCGELDAERRVSLICQGRGTGGANWEYLANTVAHLEELGIHDAALSGLLERVRARL